MKPGICFFVKSKNLTDITSTIFYSSIISVCWLVLFCYFIHGLENMWCFFQLSNLTPPPGKLKKSVPMVRICPCSKPIVNCSLNIKNERKIGGKKFI